MKPKPRDFILALGVACTWAQTLLDRSGIIPYGGATSTLDQNLIWGIIVVAAITCTAAVHFANTRRTILILGVVGIVLTLLGCVLLAILSQEGISDNATLTNAATLTFALSRAPILQIGTYFLVSNRKPVRMTLLVASLASGMVLLTTALPSSEMHLASYLFISIAGSGLMLAVARITPNLGETTPRASSLSGMGTKALLLFCALQMFPTLVSGSIGAVEMYVPFAPSPWQQITSFVAGGLLLALFALAFNAKRIPDNMLVIIPILLTICMILPLGTAKSFSPKPLFLLATQLGGDFSVLNIHRTQAKHKAPCPTLAFLGQTLVFLGLFLGSTLTGGILSASGISAVENGFYTSLALGGLMLLLAALLILLLKMQAENPAAAEPPTSTGQKTPRQGLALSSEEALSEMAKRYGLTVRELDMASFLLSGYSRQKIAKELFIAESTVKSHINSLYGKLDIHKRDELLDLVKEFQTST